MKNLLLRLFHRRPFYRYTHGMDISKMKVEYGCDCDRCKAYHLKILKK